MDLDKKEEINKMALKIQRTYVNKKTNQEVQLKTPRMRLSGKEMDDGEVAEFTILVTEPTIFSNKWFDPKDQTTKTIESYSVFCQYKGESINVQLTPQVRKEYEKIKPELNKFDKFVATKIWFDHEKTGGKLPIVDLRIVGVKGQTELKKYETPQQNKTALGDKLTEIDSKIVKAYCNTVPKEKQSLEGLMGVWAISKLKMHTPKLFEDIHTLFEVTKGMSEIPKVEEPEVIDTTE